MKSPVRALLFMTIVFLVICFQIQMNRINRMTSQIAGESSKVINLGNDILQLYSDGHDDQVRIVWKKRNKAIENRNVLIDQRNQLWMSGWSLDKSKVLPFPGDK